MHFISISIIYDISMKKDILPLPIGKSKFYGPVQISKIGIIVDSSFNVILRNLS